MSLSASYRRSLRLKERAKTPDDLKREQEARIAAMSPEERRMLARFQAEPYFTPPILSRKYRRMMRRK